MENILELSGTGEPERIFCECESECAPKDESEAYVLEGEAFDELNVADADFAEEVIQIALDSEGRRACREPQHCPKLLHRGISWKQSWPALRCSWRGQDP